MSYGTMQLKYTINEKSYLTWGFVLLLCYSIILIDFEWFGIVFFIPHIMFIIGWFIIPIINENQDYKNTLTIMELLDTQYYYLNARIEALKL